MSLVASRAGRLFRGRDILLAVMAFGLFVQISGKVWITSSSARNTQTYIWLLLPGLIFLLFRLFKHKKFLLSKASYLPWILFLIWGGASAAWATGNDVEVLSLAKRGLFIGLYLVAIRILLEYQEVYLRKALQLAIAIIAFSALISIVYQYGILGQPLAYRAYRIHALGVGGFADFGWPVAAGIFHGAVACWVFGMALDRSATFTRFLFWMICFCVLTLYVVLTYTRGAWFGLGAAALLIILWNQSRRAWLVLGAGVLIALLTTYVWWDKIVFEFTYRKLSGRGPIWDYFFSSMPGHWVIGHGLGTPFIYKWPGQETISPHAHSLYLQQIYDSGLISLGLLIIGLSCLAFEAWKLKNSYWIRLAIPALMFALVAMLTDVERIYTRPGDYWTVFWLPVAIILAVCSLQDSRKTAT